MPNVTSKGQVTIPKKIRDKLGIKKDDKIEFSEESGRVYLQVKKPLKDEEIKFHKFKGRIKSSTTSDQLVTELRGDLNTDHSD